MKLLLISICIPAIWIGGVNSSKAGDLPRIMVLGTGGTIQSKGLDRLTLYDYREGKYDINELLEQIPEVNQIADVEAVQIVNIGSPSMTAGVWKEIVTYINNCVATDKKIDGFVLTHGTNTLEETAYFLNLTVKTDLPVVMVGSQRPATAISGDGPLNLYNAIKVASDPESRGKGVLIAMNQQINAAREGTKTSTYKVEAFQARDLGIIGVIDPDGVRYYRESTKRHTVFSEFDVDKIDTWPRVDVVESHCEAPGDLINYLVERGARGIVMAGHGAGGISPGQQEQISEIGTASTTFVVCSRTGSGRVITTQRMRDSGLISGDNLLPHKARILLQLCLASGLSDTEISRVFSQY